MTYYEKRVAFQFARAALDKFFDIVSMMFLFGFAMVGALVPYYELIDKYAAALGIIRESLTAVK